MPIHDTRCGALEGVPLLEIDRAFSVERPADGVDHASHETRPDRDVENAAGAAHLVALLDQVDLAHEHATNVVVLEVEGETAHIMGKLEQLTGHHPVEPVR